MPRLLTFAPCQKAIIDRENGEVSMIAVLSGLKAHLTGDESVPENALAQVSLATVAVWGREHEDGDRVFEQQLELVNPNGVTAGQGIIPFTFTARTHNITTAFPTFPIGLPGECLFRVSVREFGDNNPWTVLLEYPFLLEHIREEGPPNEG